MKIQILILMFGAFSLSSFAQEHTPRFGVELTGGISVPLKKVNDIQMNIGGGFEATLHYRFVQHLGAYVGWGWNHFSTDNSFAGAKNDYEETGYVLGLQFNHPIGKSPISLYARAGALWNHIEIEDADGSLIKDSKHGLGYQLATGVYIPIGKNWSVNTGLKYNSLVRHDIDFSDYRSTLNLKYLSLRIGIIKMF
ncbi:porin family protein [Parabacteroides bouchesdurhonensis]|uniref:porin family protein n=1 Tax=Parabacteroides bouchesdurhonensis TaxID=1936995 RepID=UPI000E467E57|nr:porin family protein [Parabacteroides bouchesdurhonensis]RHJ95100.1 porin family protein [Bacteroides sp. AM07-16]